MKIKVIIIALVLCLLPFASSVAGAAGKKEIAIYINDVKQSYEQKPLLVQNRVYVPMRAIIEELGATVKWDSKTKTFLVKDDGLDLSWKINSKQYKRNGQTMVSDAAPFIKDGVTYVPLRAISEILSAYVMWNSTEPSVSITHDYTRAWLKEGSYAVDHRTGDIYERTGSHARKKIASLDSEIVGNAFINGYTTGNGNTVLTINDNYGEPHINNDFYTVYLRSGSTPQISQAYYHNRFEENAVVQGNYVILNDGHNAVIYDDRSGKPLRGHDLTVLGGEDDSYFIEGYGEDYILIRPNKKGLLMLIDPKTKERTLLYKELLPPKEQEYAEKNDIPYYGDALKFTNEKDGILYFNFYSVIDQKEYKFQYKYK
ncbi:copper amine oxidase N-terminal domain-containing protein [Bacillus infantis]|uniref:copper amine oxidase N-terminal domain-containing protein n=1 Tax=Bacillus infantis TaxID=324767 RepID=UPI003CF9DA89